MDLWITNRTGETIFKDKETGKDYNQLELIQELVHKINDLEKFKEDYNKEKEIMIHYHKDKYPGILALEKHGNFYDVRAAKDTWLKEGVHTLIPLGFSLYLPDGYYAELLPRSSSFKNFGFTVANSMGIIDTEYRGMKDEWMLSVLPHRDIIINKNERIAQFTIVKEEKFVLKEGNWNAKDRKGFGASGKI